MKIQSTSLDMVIQSFLKRVNLGIFSHFILGKGYRILQNISRNMRYLGPPSRGEGCAWSLLCDIVFCVLSNYAIILI